MAPPFLTSILDGGAWSASRPSRFILGEMTTGTLCTVWKQSGDLEVQRYAFLTPTLRSRSSLLYWLQIPAELIQQKADDSWSILNVAVTRTRIPALLLRIETWSSSPYHVSVYWIIMRPMCRLHYRCICVCYIHDNKLHALVQYTVCTLKLNQCNVDYFVNIWCYFRAIPCPIAYFNAAGSLTKLKYAKWI
jgi:hypothetical protein